MYPRQVSVKKFSLNEVAATVMFSGSIALQIEKSPDPPQSLMVFRNGQLLTFSTDYTESNRIVRLVGGTVEEDDIFLATYSYMD
jgi:7-cyano-7-deazaguanine synthase in queuosine biosynthesis